MKKYLYMLAPLFVILGVVGITQLGAQTSSWNSPSVAAPGGNVSVPIHVGVGDQVKDGGLSVNTFLAAQSAQFDQNVFISGIVRGGTPASSTSTVSFGGTDQLGVNRIVDLLVSGGVNAAGNIQSTTLQGSAQTPVCANASGELELCQNTTISSPSLVPIDACVLPTSANSTVTVSTMAKGFVMYEMHGTFDPTSTYSWHFNGANGVSIIPASACNGSTKNPKKISCVVFFTAGTDPRSGSVVNPFATTMVSLIITPASGTPTTLTGTSATSLDNASYCITAGR